MYVGLFVIVNIDAILVYMAVEGQLVIVQLRTPIAKVIN